MNFRFPKLQKLRQRFGRDCGVRLDVREGSVDRFCAVPNREPPRWSGKRMISAEDHIRKRTLQLRSDALGLKRLHSTSDLFCWISPGFDSRTMTLMTLVVFEPFPILISSPELI